MEENENKGGIEKPSEKISFSQKLARIAVAAIIAAGGIVYKYVKPSSTINPEVNRKSVSEPLGEQEQVQGNLEQRRGNLIEAYMEALGRYQKNPDDRTAYGEMSKISLQFTKKERDEVSLLREQEKIERRLKEYQQIQNARRKLLEEKGERDNDLNGFNGGDKHQKRQCEGRLRDYSNRVMRCNADAYSWNDPMQRKGTGFSLKEIRSQQAYLPTLLKERPEMEPRIRAVEGRLRQLAEVSKQEVKEIELPEIHAALGGLIPREAPRKLEFPVTKRYRDKTGKEIVVITSDPNGRLHTIEQDPQTGTVTFRNKHTGFKVDPKRKLTPKEQEERGEWLKDLERRGEYFPGGDVKESLDRRLEQFKREGK